MAEQQPKPEALDQQDAADGLENDPISSVIDARIEAAINRNLPEALQRLGNSREGRESQ